MTISVGDRLVGVDQSVFIIAEIGINHNGSVESAKELIDVAHQAGCDAVKFQKRTPELAVPDEQKPIPRDTPWGRMTYIEYKERIEFGRDEYDEIDSHCRALGIMWFASCWDEPSVEFIEAYDPPAYKLASASLTDEPLLRACLDTQRPIIVSTGMSTMDEIREAVSLCDQGRLAIAHSTSTYPCPPTELNLRMLHTLADEFSVPVGYSGHEVGLQTTLAAVAMGATFVERHITLDRASWGTDQAASVEPSGLNRLVRDIRVIESALGDGVKRVYESELPIREKLRRA